MSFVQFYLPSEQLDPINKRIEENENIDMRSRYVFHGPTKILSTPKRADDIHIFQVDENNEIEKSCCGNFRLHSKQAAGASSMDSKKAREVASELGRFVCGRCAASLYSDKDSSASEAS